MFIKRLVSLLTAALALVMVCLPITANAQVRPTKFGACCPPWNSAQLLASLSYQGTTIGQPYTLHFAAPPTVITQMDAYVTYLQTLGMGFTSISMKFELFNAGTALTAVPSGASINTVTIGWTGTPPFVPSFFMPATQFAVGPWYRVKTTLTLNGGPGTSWWPKECAVSYIDVRIQAVPSARAGAPGPMALEARLDDGSIVQLPASQK